MLLVVNGLQWPSRRTEPKTHRWDPIGLQIARRSFEASIDDLRITQGWRGLWQARDDDSLNVIPIENEDSLFFFFVVSCENCAVHWTRIRNQAYNHLWRTHHFSGCRAYCVDTVASSASSVVSTLIRSPRSFQFLNIHSGSTFLMNKIFYIGELR